MSILVAEANRRGLTLAPEEASGLTVLLSLVAGYFVQGDPAPVPATQTLPQISIPTPLQSSTPKIVMAPSGLPTSAMPAPQGSPSNAQPS